MDSALKLMMGELDLPEKTSVSQIKAAETAKEAEPENEAEIEAEIEAKVPDNGKDQKNNRRRKLIKLGIMVVLLGLMLIFMTV